MRAAHDEAADIKPLSAASTVNGSVEPMDLKQPLQTQMPMPMLREKASFATRLGPKRSATMYSYERFHHGQQLRRMIVRCSCRWLMTVIIAAAIYALLYNYSRKKAWPVETRNKFNTLMIGLSIALSLNIASSLKDNIGQMRWWLLSLREHTPREMDLILQSENLRRVVMLVWTSRSLVVQVFVFHYIALHLASQIGLALLGITYNINPADTHTVTSPGLVQIPNMTELQLHLDSATMERLAPSEAQLVNNRRWIANALGISSHYAANVGTMASAPDPGQIRQAGDPWIFCDEGERRNTCSYFFMEQAVRASPWQAHVATNRSISVRTSCQAYHVLRGGDGRSHEILVQIPGLSDQPVHIPFASGPGRTLYLHDPRWDHNYSWAQIRAFETSERRSWAYFCNTSFGPVVNAAIDEHHVGKEILRLAGPAIALLGCASTKTDESPHRRHKKGPGEDPMELQWQSYPPPTTFGIPRRGDHREVEMAMSRFALNSLAAILESNAKIEVPGMSPQHGISLEITSWQSLHVILGLVVGLQFLLAAVSIFFSNRVQVRCHSYLSACALLRPCMRHVGCKASAATGSEVASLMGGRDTRLRYVQTKNGEFHLRSNQMGSDDERACAGTVSCRDCGA